MQVTRAKGGRMLAVAQITANQVGVDTSITDITGLSITVTPRGVIPVWVELYLWSIKQVTSNAAILAYIRNGTNVVGYALQDTIAGSSWGGVYVKRRLVPGTTVGFTAGTPYTFKGSWQTTAGTADVKANVDNITTTGGPGYLLAYEENV
jgi:hypothetical protein